MRKLWKIQDISPTLGLISTLPNINRIFPSLAIRAKLIIAFVGLSILPVLLVGLYGISSNMSTLRNFALENLTHDVHTVRVRAATFLSGVGSDLLVLRHSSATEHFIAEVNSHPDSIGPITNAEITEEFLAFVRMKELYFQISIFNEEQAVLLRIECNDIVESSLHFSSVPPGRFREGSGELYFLLVKELRNDQIGFGPAEMVYRDTMQIPVVNFILPLVVNEKRVGILVASVFAERLFDVMQTQRNLGADEKVVLVGSEGYYLYSSELQNRWDQLIALRKDQNLYNNFPSDIARRILSGSTGIIAEGTDDIIAYAPLASVSETEALVMTQPTNFSELLYIFESVPRNQILGPARSFGWTFASFLLVFFAGAVGLGLLATRQFTKPIEEVTRSAEIISRGNYAHRLNVQTGDEIQKLAAQFNAMAASLETHEQEISQHRLRLEEIVEKRTTELVSEKSKLQAILDVVPSAFVLLDNEFRIQTTSAAFTAITGFPSSDVKGKDCRQIFSNQKLCKGTPYERISSTKKIENHIDRMVDRNGAEKFIEHITIPILEDDVIRSIVMIITDITRRKHLEEQLIQSEKLMATGEMSAIIAHEFRNALTSIKMILQLQHESMEADSNDQKSLSVALESIYHMESIVRELLNFARPSPMEFQTEDINGIVDECLVFAQLRVHKKQILLSKEIDAHIPAIQIDAPRIKEALINLLINSIQAIESTARDDRENEICVYAKGVGLTKTFRDFAPPQLHEHREGIEELGEHEVVLRKGT